jgi:hypothetical protein
MHPASVACQGFQRRTSISIGPGLVEISLDSFELRLSVQRVLVAGVRGRCRQSDEDGAKQAADEATHGPSP